MFMLGFAPLLIPLAIYNIIAFPMSSVTWNAVVSTVRMPSGPDWTMSAGDMLVACAAVWRSDELEPRRNSHRGRPRLDPDPLPGMLLEFILIKEVRPRPFSCC